MPFRRAPGRHAWTALYATWLGCCLLGYASNLRALPLAGYVVSPAGVVLTAAVGVLLAWYAVRALGGADTATRWQPWQMWPVSARVGLVSCALLLAVFAVQLCEGQLQSLFGMYLVLSQLLFFVYIGGRRAPVP